MLNINEMTTKYNILNLDDPELLNKVKQLIGDDCDTKTKSEII